MIINNNPSNTSFQATVLARGNHLGRNEMNSAITEIRKLAAEIPNSETDIITLAAEAIGCKGKIEGHLGYYRDFDAPTEATVTESIEPLSHQLIPTAKQWVDAAKKLIERATGNQPTI